MADMPVVVEMPPEESRNWHVLPDDDEHTERFYQAADHLCSVVENWEIHVLSALTVKTVSGDASNNIREDSTSADGNSTSADSNSTSADSNSTSPDSNSTRADGNSTSADGNSTSPDSNSTRADSNDGVTSRNGSGVSDTATDTSSVIPKLLTSDDVTIDIDGFGETSEVLSTGLKNFLVIAADPGSLNYIIMDRLIHVFLGSCGILLVLKRWIASKRLRIPNGFETQVLKCMWDSPALRSTTRYADIFYTILVTGRVPGGGPIRVIALKSDPRENEKILFNYECAPKQMTNGTGTAWDAGVTAALLNASNGVLLQTPKLFEKAHGGLHHHVVNAMRHTLHALAEFAYDEMRELLPRTTAGGQILVVRVKLKYENGAYALDGVNMSGSCILVNDFTDAAPGVAMAMCMLDPNKQILMLVHCENPDPNIARCSVFVVARDILVIKTRFNAETGAS